MVLSAQHPGPRYRAQKPRNLIMKSDQWEDRQTVELIISKNTIYNNNLFYFTDYHGG